MIKKIFSFFAYIFKTIYWGFYYDCLLLTKGFFFYFRLPFILLNKLKNNKVFLKIDAFFKNRQKDPITFMILVLVFFVFMFLHTYLYDDHRTVYVDENVGSEEIPDKDNKEVDNSNNSLENNQGSSNLEIDMYKRYGSTKVENINFSELKQTNSDVVAWLIVDGTNVNYPIVQTIDNDYYLNHNIKKDPKVSGWTFMDYRNSKEINDTNTIFYGHNLLNKTGFGSLSNIFTDKWFNTSNHKIIVLTENKKYIYEVFSCYSIEPEVYYLNNNFNNSLEYQEFLNVLISRSIYKFNINVGVNDKIITLSTCTDDNMGRKVVHAKLIG